MVHLLDLPIELLELIFLNTDPLDICHLHSKIDIIICNPNFLRKLYVSKRYENAETYLKYDVSQVLLKIISQLFDDNITEINQLLRLVILTYYPKIIVNEKVINYLLFYSELETVKKLIRWCPKINIDNDMLKQITSQNIEENFMSLPTLLFCIQGFNTKKVEYVPLILEVIKELLPITDEKIIQHSLKYCLLNCKNSLSYISFYSFIDNQLLTLILQLSFTNFIYLIENINYYNSERCTKYMIMLNSHVKRMKNLINIEPLIISALYIGKIPVEVSNIFNPIIA